MAVFYLGHFQRQLIIDSLITEKQKYCEGIKRLCLTNLTSTIHINSYYSINKELISKVNQLETLINIFKNDNGNRVK